MADFTRLSTTRHATPLHSDNSIQHKLHEWINRVKPVNSFITTVDREVLRSLDDPTITAAAWMHVDSGAVQTTFVTLH
jgi:hypothetical protein